MSLTEEIKKLAQAAGSDIKMLLGKLGTDDKPIVSYPQERGRDVFSVLQWLADTSAPIHDDVPPSGDILFSAAKTDELVRRLSGQVRGIGRVEDAVLLDRISKAHGVLSKKWQDAADAGLLKALADAVAAARAKAAGFVPDDKRTGLSGMADALDAVADKETLADADKQTVQAQAAALAAWAEGVVPDASLHGADSLRAAGVALTGLDGRITALTEQIGNLDGQAVRKVDFNSVAVTGLRIEGGVLQMQKAGSTDWQNVGAV